MADEFAHAHISRDRKGLFHQEVTEVQETPGEIQINAVPELLSNPLRAPEVISAHSADIDAVSTAARTIGRVVDLSQQDPNRIRWGFYINASRAPGGGLGVTAGAGVLF